MQVLKASNIDSGKEDYELDSNSSKHEDSYSKLGGPVLTPEFGNGYLYISKDIYHARLIGFHGEVTHVVMRRIGKVHDHYIRLYTSSRLTYMGVYIQLG
jgi:hypothetical protein